MRTTFVLILLGTLLSLGVPIAATAKGCQRIVLISSDGRSVEIGADESVIDKALSERGAVRRIRSGYLRLFFVGPGDFPANPGRYYPEQGCVAHDWPTSETSCRRVAPVVVRLLRPAHTLSTFRARPTVLAQITYHGTSPGMLKTAAPLKNSVELALDRTGRQAPEPRRCFAFTGTWRGPAAAARPRRFSLCPNGVHAAHRLYPLRHGVWEWFQLNVGTPP